MLTSVISQNRNNYPYVLSNVAYSINVNRTTLETLTKLAEGIIALITTGLGYNSNQLENKAIQR